MAKQTEREQREYVATPDELLTIDAAMASIDAAEVATKAEIEAALARLRRTG